MTSSGAKAGKGWLFDKNYNSWFYINYDGNYADKEWLWDNGYYYLKSGGYMAASVGMVQEQLVLPQVKWKDG